MLQVLVGGDLRQGIVCCIHKSLNPGWITGRVLHEMFQSRVDGRRIGWSAGCTGEIGFAVIGSDRFSFSVETHQAPFHMVGHDPPDHRGNQRIFIQRDIVRIGGKQVGMKPQRLYAPRAETCPARLEGKRPQWFGTNRLNLPLAQQVFIASPNINQPQPVTRKEPARTGKKGWEGLGASRASLPMTAPISFENRCSC